MMKAYQYFIEHSDKIGGWVLDHLIISLIAIGIGALLGIGIGIFMSAKGRERMAEAVLYLAEIMMTVPSLALFGLFMLLLSYLDLKAIGMLPAVITLVIYGQMPILRNTYTAIRDVDEDMIEAGRGMGMDSKELLLKVQLPLALPVIMAGLRNAMVLIIGITAIAALIGSSGLGVPIFRGLRNARMDLIIVGGVSVSLLALFVDGVMALLEKWIQPKGVKS